jgi:hypothetical protein
MVEQLVLVALVTIASVGYLGLRAWRTWSARSGCGGGCGCAATKKAENAGLIGVEELMGRVRETRDRREVNGRSGGGFIAPDRASGLPRPRAGPGRRP